MLNAFGKISCLLLLGLLLLSCGDAELIGRADPKVLAEISEVLKRWREGYENEDVDTYMSAFWPEGFRWISDMGTDHDTTDDVEFDDIRKEREAAIRVFAKYQDIEIELEEPPQVELNADQTRAEVRAHYRIQGFISDGLLTGGYTGWYAEGDNLFIFEHRQDEWRITEWIDEAFSTEEIKQANNL